MRERENCPRYGFLAAASYLAGALGCVVLAQLAQPHARWALLWRDVLTNGLFWAGSVIFWATLFCYWRQRVTRLGVALLALLFGGYLWRMALLLPVGTGAAWARLVALTGLGGALLLPIVLQMMLGGGLSLRRGRWALLAINVAALLSVVCIPLVLL